MRNLEVSKTISFHSECLKDTLLICHDPVSDCCYFISNQVLYKLYPSKHEQFQLISLSEHGCIDPDGGGRVVYLSYLIEQDAVCFIMQDGNIFLYHVLNEQVETIGAVCDGVESALWSLDGNNLVLITGENMVIIMNRDFEPLHEIPLFGSDTVENHLVSLGWGKKETQFRGSEGKATFETPNMDTIIEKNLDDKIPKITWSGDGQLFAVNSVTPNSERQVRIFSVDGTLQAITHDIKLLESEIHWQPSGCLLAASQKLPNKYQVIFIENNGLQHGEFVLPKANKQSVIKHILWNADSSLLAICLRNEDNNLYELQIWTRSNYHWYLKQNIKLPKEQYFLAVTWHNENPMSLTFITSDGCYKQVIWRWCVNRSKGSIIQNDAFVGVVDDNKLLLTPFRRMVMPPPEAAVIAELPSFVNFLIFPELSSSPLSVAAILADDQVVILSVNEGNSYTLENVYSLKWSINEKHCPVLLHHWIWPKPSLFLALYTKESSSVLCKISISEMEEFLTVEPLHELSKMIVNVCYSNALNVIFLQTSDGDILMYSIENNMLSPWTNFAGKIVSFPYECDTMESCIFAGKELLFGLSHNYKLFCEDVEIMNNCSSFALHNEFLLVTTLNHTLCCIPLSSFVHDSVSKKLTFEAKNNENVRNVERGSRIITCIPEDTKLILQMPRGNLECIHPRPLSISAVAKYLDELKFYDAFSLMRRHRINMNLIFDHNPKKFLENIDKFVTDINKVNWLNVFLTDLSNENIAATMYQDIYQLIDKTKELPVYENKINTICKAVRSSLMKIDCKKYFLVILTTFVLMNPSELENALLMISEIKRNEGDLSIVDAALNYLQYLVDVNDMYTAALGTYNFDMVIMVAQKTQKDPKEYLPFLNELRSMEENYQKFSIDRYLKRPIKALENIIKCDKKYFNECLDYIQIHVLYKRALNLFPLQSEEYKAICIAYGGYLEKKHKMEEAAIFYHRGGRSDLAMEIFEQNLNWQEAMHMAFSIGKSESSIVQLAIRLAEKLKERNQHKDAAHLLELYAKHPEESIAALIEGCHWQMALEAICRHRRSDITLTHLYPALKDHCSLVINSINAAKSSFERYSTRLMKLREEKQKTLTISGINDCIFNDAASDITNVTDMTNRTFVSGTNSRISGRTCRSQRKEERKKHSLKEGSVYEDRALLEALAEIVTSVDKLKDDCSTLLRMLLLFNFDKEAQLLQTQFTELVDMINKQVHNIWKFPPENFMQNWPGNVSEGLTLSKNEHSVNSEEIRLMLPPLMKQNSWKVDIFGE